MLKKAGLPQEIIAAVKCHNDLHGLARKSLMDKALYAVDPLTGLIVAAALIKPEKKLAAVDVPFFAESFSGKIICPGGSP